MIGLPEAAVVGASSRSKILSESLLARLMGLRKCRLAIAGRGLVVVDVGFGGVLSLVVECRASKVLSWDLDLDLEPQSMSVFT